MDIDETEIRTGVDSLIKLLYEKKRLSLEETSKALGLPKERLEDWARVLEGEGILKIEYAFTKTYLVWTAGEAGGEAKETSEGSRRGAGFSGGEGGRGAGLGGGGAARGAGFGGGRHRLRNLPAFGPGADKGRAGAKA